jgi:hypothetical protein
MSQQMSTIWARWTRVWSKVGNDHDDTETFNLKLGESKCVDEVKEILHSTDFLIDLPTDPERSRRRDAFVSPPLPLLPLTQLAQQSFGRGGIGNIRRSSLSRRVCPTHTRGREPEVGAPSLRTPCPYTDIPRSGLFCRTRWCRKHTLPPQGRAAHHQGRSGGRVRGQGCPQTRRGNHHRKHSSTFQTHPSPSSI